VIDDARVQRLKDEASRQLNAGEKYMLVNPATVIVLCDTVLKKTPRMTATCPQCGGEVSWADQQASCVKGCLWRGPYPDMR
jgi:hypothetical protein